VPNGNSAAAATSPGSPTESSDLASASRDPVSSPDLTEALDTDTEEVRLAMALNGGVSLAVWMGGVAVELDRARRAHKGAEPRESLEPLELYTAICGAFQRRFVVDIMSGASAGGLNGSLLAAAIRSGRRLGVEMLRTTGFRRATSSGCCSRWRAAIRRR
jgi:hypothetical protein